MDLVRIALAGLNDADEVIAKLRMSTRQLHFGHVASCAILLCDWTDPGVDTSGRRHAFCVARQTLGVVEADGAIGRLVWIVTGEATDSRIAADETLAEFEAIGLKAHESRAPPVVAHGAVEGAVALTAKAGDLLRIETLERFRERLEIVMERICHVLLCTNVAALTSNAGLERGRTEFLAGVQTARVTVEAGVDLGRGQLAPHRLTQVVGRDLLVARGGGEFLRAWVEADEAFVHVAVSFKHPGLRVMAEAPADRKGY